MKSYNIIDKKAKRYFFVLLVFLCRLDITAQNDSDTLNVKTDTLDIEILRDTLPSVTPLSAESLGIDTAFSNPIYNKNFKFAPNKVNIYDAPYSMTANYPNYKRLALNTGVLYGAGFVTLGVLQLLPEDATSWNKKEITNRPPFRRWVDNVKKGPVWDKDNAVFNYILHPYGGAAYYMGARSQGFNILYSFLYSAGISTLFWEYGIEAFMEIPSIQDLIITPTAGTLIGEGFYILKRHIVSNDYRLFGSRFLGNVTAYIIDPVNEVIGIFAGNPNRKKQVSVACTPWFNKTGSGNTFGFTVSLSY